MSLQSPKIIYFIYSYPVSLINKCSIWIDDDSKINKNITIKETNIIGDDVKEDFYLFVAKFPIIISHIEQLKPKFKFRLKLKVNEKEFNSNYFEFDLKKNSFFIYNLKFDKFQKYNIISIKSIGVIDNYIDPPRIFNMDFEDQYYFYTNYLTFDDDLILKDFNYYSINKLETLSEINFIFFLDVFNDCRYQNDFQNVQNLIIIFYKIKKIKFPIEIKKLEKFKELIKTISSKHYQYDATSIFKTEEKYYFLGLHKIILYFYNIQNDDENFNNYLKNNNNDDIKKIILEENSIFKQLNFDCIKTFLQNAKNLEDIYLSLKKSENIEILLKLIINNFSYIKNILNDTNDGIKIDFNGNVSDNILSIIDLYKNCINKQIDLSKKIELDDKIWYDYVSIFKKTDIEKLFNLYNICEVLSESQKSDFKNKLFKAIDETLKYEIINQNLKNLSMLKYLKKCLDNLNSHLDENEKKNKKLSLEIYDYIDLSLIDENIIQMFSEITLDKFELNQINGFLKNVNSLKDFYNIIKIFKTEINDNQLIEELTKKFSDMMKKEKDKNNVEFCNLISHIIFLIPFSSQKLFNEIEKYLPEEFIIPIYLYILNKNSLDYDTKEYILSFLLKKKTFNVDVLAKFLSVVRKENIIIDMLKKLNDGKYFIKNEDFYNINKNENLQFIEILIKNQIFSNENIKKKSDYIKKIDKIISILKSELIYYQINYKNINKLHELIQKNELNKRLDIIFYKEGINYKMSFEKQLMEKINEIMDFKEKINKIKSLFETFYKENKDKELQVYQNIENEIKNKLLKDLGEYIKKKVNQKRLIKLIIMY